MSSGSNNSKSNSNRKKRVGEELGGKTARACDNCVKRRARWFCAADDAFLCQPCDASVHSANSLARRHHRLRLNTSSSSLDPLPTWHRGLTRKPRTPRLGKQHVTSPTSFPLVPDTSASQDEQTTDDLLLYRVPVFGAESESEIGSLALALAPPPTEMDLAEFAADVESLLGRGLEDECDFGIQALGFLDCDEKRVKLELDREDASFDATMNICWTETSTEMDMTPPEPLDLNFDEYDCEDDNQKPTVLAGQPKLELDDEDEEEDEEEEEEEMTMDESQSSGKKKKKKKKKEILLRLDYEGVITAWASQGSPWTTGDRPDFDPDASWPNCMGTYGAQFHHHHHYMDLSGIGATPALLADGGREARVSRYREKRRTRLFSKKIRYEVRKLNAEKRPRMKGRFVKRASFVGPSFPMLK